MSVNFFIVFLSLYTYLIIRMQIINFHILIFTAIINHDNIKTNQRIY